MSKGKRSISKARSYQEIRELWDTDDLTDYWAQTQSVDFEVEIQSEVTYYPVESTLSAKLSAMARQRGVSPETLLNLWLQAKVREEMAHR